MAWSACGPRLTPPPAPLPFILGHPQETLAHVHGSLRRYYHDLLRDAGGSPILTPFALLGVLVMARRWLQWAPLALYGILLLAMFSISTPTTRYLLSLIPPWLVLAAVGMMWVGDRAGRLARWPGLALRAAMAVAMLAVSADLARRAAATALDRTSLWNPAMSANGLEQMAAGEFIRAHAAPDEPILTVEVYLASYLIGRPAINLPFDQPTLLALRARWKPTYLVASDPERSERLPGWADHPRRWAHPVWRRGPDEIARALGAGSFPYLSAVTIYRLDPPE